MRAIYIPKGRAKEYSDYALNIYRGCSFGCKYCFSPATLYIERQKFYSEQTVKRNLLYDVEKDCKQLKKANFNSRVLLCFACDPYQDIDLELQMTREVLKLFKEYNINFQLLTKGGTRAIRDFDLYKPGDAFASTLTFIDSGKSRLWEPNAALPEDRFAALEAAHNHGIETWVSLEPVIEPEETHAIVDRTHEYVDLYKIEPINYNSDKKNAINWVKFANDMQERLHKYGKGYYLKEELQKLIKTDGHRRKER